MGLKVADPCGNEDSRGKGMVDINIPYRSEEKKVGN